MLQMAAIHQRALRDQRKLDSDDAALGLDSVSRKLLRIMLKDALH